MNPLGKLCNHCKTAWVRTKLCKCVHVRYCSKVCQRQDWNKHKKVCKIMTPRKCNMDFENKLVKCLTTESEPELMLFFRPMAGACVSFEYLYDDLNEITVGQISGQIGASILNTIGKFYHGNSIPCKIKCSGKSDRLVDLIPNPKIFPHSDDQCVHIYFTYSIYNDNGESLKITKSIQLVVDEIEVE